MNYIELSEAKSKYRPNDVKKSRSELYSHRNKFIRKFSQKRIAKMSIDDYIEGKKNTESFCYYVERRFDKLGCIRGASSRLFELYYSKEQQDYWFSTKFGKTCNEAFDAIKSEILNLLEAGEKHDLEAIVSNKLKPTFKGKILSLYFPDRYLNIFSGEHLIHYLRVFNRDRKNLIKLDPVYMREELLSIKQADPDMKDWDVDIFGAFLYTFFPPEDNKKKGKNEVKFNPLVPPEEIILKIIPSTGHKESTPPKASTKSKVNYEAEARRWRKLGDRGEAIVMEFEKQRLKEIGLSSKEIRQVLTQQSQISDSIGYDIISINNDRTNRYIEVKATSGKAGDVKFYYTQNEYEKAKEYGEDYYLYIVFEVCSKKPKVWIQRNPFIDDGKDISMEPVQYKVSISTTEIQ